MSSPDPRTPTLTPLGYGAANVGKQLGAVALVAVGVATALAPTGATALLELRGGRHLPRRLARAGGVVVEGVRRLVAEPRVDARVPRHRHRAGWAPPPHCPPDWPGSLNPVSMWRGTTAPRPAHSLLQQPAQVLHQQV